MLNENNQRELAYVVRIAEIRPLEGYDRVEYARIGAGWWVVVRKGQFKVDDLAVYFEIDSKVPQKEPFMFLENKKFKVKTQKMCKVVSQGLLMSFDDFGWPEDKYPEGTFLTNELGVAYADDDDNKRKAPSGDRYRSMQDRHKKLFKNKFVKKIMRYELGRKIMFLFFGKKRDKKTDWPYWVVKTDEERVQNLPWLFPGNGEEWIATEKIDGTSTTFTVKGFGRRRKFYVCSRNVVFDKPDKSCFYDTNVYTEMAEKYDIENVLAKTLDEYRKNISKDIEFITIQGETFGASVQNRDYEMSDRDFYVFNIIYGFKNGVTLRLNPIEGAKAAKNAGLKYVPIVDEHFKIPETCEQLLDIATGTSMVDGGMREGLVFRSYDGVRSFKAVSNEFLLKYHC